MGHVTKFSGLRKEVSAEKNDRKAEVVRYLDADSGELLHDVRFAFLLRTSIIVLLSLKVTKTVLQWTITSAVLDGTSNAIKWEIHGMLCNRKALFQILTLTLYVNSS